LVTNITVPVFMYKRLTRKLASIDVSDCKGVRNLIQITAQDVKCVHRFIENHVRESFGVGEMSLHVPVMVVAPPKKSRGYHDHTKGPIHRDVHTTMLGYWSILFFLDEVTPDNGAVRVWPKTQDTKLDEYNPARAVKGKPTQILTGPPGTAYVFDSRVIHRSLPNTTDHARRTVQWLVTTPGVPALDIAF
jgi:ectoine hydroxylase-related dioxygenase (phytanoyl-CoA dioxygenase family)